MGVDARKVGIPPGETEDAWKVDVSPGESVVAQNTGIPRARLIMSYCWIVLIIIV